MRGQVPYNNRTGYACARIRHKTAGIDLQYPILIDRVNCRYTVAPAYPMVTHLNMILPARTWM